MTNNYYELKGFYHLLLFSQNGCKNEWHVHKRTSPLKFSWRVFNSESTNWLIYNNIWKGFFTEIEWCTNLYFNIFLYFLPFPKTNANLRLCLLNASLNKYVREEKIGKHQLRPNAEYGANKSHTNSCRWDSRDCYAKRAVVSPSHVLNPTQ